MTMFAPHESDEKQLPISLMLAYATVSAVNVVLVNSSKKQFLKEYCLVSSHSPLLPPSSTMMV